MSNVTLRFGLVGTGYRAREVHAPGIAAAPGITLAAVRGQDPASVWIGRDVLALLASAQRQIDAGTQP
jgi:predicted dehydrogenase